MKPNAYFADVLAQLPESGRAEADKALAQAKADPLTADTPHAYALGWTQQTLTSLIEEYRKLHAAYVAACEEPTP